MASIMVSIGIAFLITLLFMFALPPVARSIGLIDRPGGRKMHIGEIPVTGGLAMAAGLILTSPFLLSDVPGYPFFLAAVAILVLIGALDDRFDLPASVRLLAQCCAVLIMALGANVLVHDIGHPFFRSGGPRLAVGLFTIVIVLTAINAFNMFDGSDGVAGIQALIALVFLGVACVIAGSTRYLPLVLGPAGCIVGFLMFNWPSKRTRNVRAFMGDAGSTMLGFSLAWLSVDLSQGAARVISPVVTLWVFALPLYDLFSSMVRRVSQGASPFHGDSEHLHHILRRFGFSSRASRAGRAARSSVFGMIGVGAYLVDVSDGWLFTGWIVLGIGYHIIFGSGLVIPRRETPRRRRHSRPSTGPWKQRERQWSKSDPLRANT